MSKIEKTVFISYRRASVPWALNIFRELHGEGFDVFFDFQGLASGDFERVILENIRARAHFLVLLTPDALDRCTNPNDLFRREIEEAIGHKRNIVPLMLDGFDFGAPGLDQKLGDTLIPLKGYNGLGVPVDYFSAAMKRLRDTYLSVSLDTVLHPPSTPAINAAQEDQRAAAIAPPVTEQELRTLAEPRHTFTIRLDYIDNLNFVVGTKAEEPSGPGTLVIYDGIAVVARYNNVTWWARNAPN